MKRLILTLSILILAGNGWAQRRDRGAQGFEFGPRTPEPGEMSHQVELLTIDGDRVHLTDVRKKYLVFEFVHPGDKTASAKTATMNALRAKYAKDDRVVFWTVLGQGEYEQNGRVGREERQPKRERVDTSKWTSFLKEHQSEFSGTKLLSDADLAIARTVYGGYINQTYLIDPEGRVVDRWSWCDPGALETTIDRELGIMESKRVTSGTITVRPVIPVSQRVRDSRRRVQTIPVARELVRNGSKQFILDRDKDGSGDLSATESGFAKEIFNRVDRDQNGSLSAEEMQLAEEAASERMPSD